MQTTQSSSTHLKNFILVGNVLWAWLTSNLKPLQIQRLAHQMHLIKSNSVLKMKMHFYWLRGILGPIQVSVTTCNCPLQWTYSKYLSSLERTSLSSTSTAWKITRTTCFGSTAKSTALSQPVNCWACWIKNWQSRQPVNKVPQIRLSNKMCWLFRTKNTTTLLSATMSFGRNIIWSNSLLIFKLFQRM